MILRELIVDALRVIGVIEAGHGASADEDVEDLRAINGMLNSWRTERLMAYSMQTNIYTVAANGTIAVPRPVRIENVWLINGASFSEREINGNQFRYAGGIFSDAAYPTSTLTMNPPLTPGTQVVLESWAVLPAFTSLNDTISFPDGYLEAALYNLALRLAPRYRDAMVSPLVEREARESKANVKRMNAQTPVLSLDPALLGGGGYGGWVSGGYWLYGGGGAAESGDTGGITVIDMAAVMVAVLAEIDSINTVAFSATPNFNLALGRTQRITLTGAVTASTITNQVAGRKYTFHILQDGAGEHPFAWPAQMRGELEVGGEAGMGSQQTFISDGTLMWAIGVINA